MLHKKYVEYNGQTIKFSIWFKKGKGYSVSAVPVKITKHDGYSMEEFGAFTGFTDWLLLVDRQSAKRLQSAINTLNEREAKYLEYFDKV